VATAFVVKDDKSHAIDLLLADIGGGKFKFLLFVITLMKTDLRERLVSSVIAQ
jgi:hypothetical protein